MTKFFLLLLIFLFSNSFSFAQDNKVLSTGINFRRAPYSYFTDDELLGLDVEIASSIFTSLGYKPEYIDISYARGIKLLEEYEIDYTIGVVEEESSYSKFWRSRPFRSEFITIIVRREDRDKYQLKNIEDLLNYSDYTFAARRGAWLGRDFAQMIKENKKLNDKIIYLPRTAQRLRLLLSNRVDFLIGDKYAIYYTAKKLGVENELYITNVVINKTNVCYLFNEDKVDQNFRDELDLAIAKIWASEKYFQLFEKYR